MLFSDMTRETIRDCASAAVAVVPCGAVEQHGPHLAVGTDGLLVTKISTSAARQAERDVGVIVTPPVSFGISNHHKPHPGVLSFGPATFIAVLNDLGCCLVESGFRAIAFVNGHNGNEEALKLVARDLNNRFPATFAATSYWTAAWDELDREGILDEVGRIPGHAGKFETALMLCLDAGLVARERIPPSLPAASNSRHRPRPAVFPAAGNHGAGPGYSDAPIEANEALGQRIFAVCVTGLAKLFVDLGKDLRKEG